MHRIAEIKKLLVTHDYVPILRKMGDGVVFYLPHPKLRHPKNPRLTEAYAIRRGAEAGMFYNSSLSPDEKFVSVPEYAMRLFLMSNASACCGRVLIDDRLICYLDEEGREKDDIESVVDPPSTDGERSKEGFLTRLILQARGDGFPSDLEEAALTHGVHEGYRLVKSFFEVRKP